VPRPRRDLGVHIMATRITRDVIESYLNCPLKGHLKLAGQQGTKCDYERLLMEQRAGITRQGTDTLLAQYPKDQIASGLGLTKETLQRGLQFILDAALEDDSLSLVFDALKRVDGRSSLGEFHYVPVLFCEGRKIRNEQRLRSDEQAV
jgi:predicted RecB family nuclease